MKVYYDKDADLKAIRGKTVAIIGYGSQGHAHAGNLKDSGIEVIVGLREGSPSWTKAEQAGHKVMPVAQSAAMGDIIMILIPDENQAEMYKGEIGPNLREGKALAFAHGFNIHFNQIVPPRNVDVFMVAPKAPGYRLRQEFVAGRGVPILIAVQQDYTGRAKDMALAYAVCLGGGKVGILETTFREETETDLFGEQVVLCGGVMALVVQAYETLVEAGYAPEMAYFECLHELKLIVDLIYEGGFTNMNRWVSNTAQYGELTRGPRVIDDHVKETMRQILSEVQSGTFAKEWVLENKAGRPVFNALTKRLEEHQIERVGAELRKMMGFLSKER